jgi:diguanylate cyclase (GGDEF)-like protein/PAS domain S-box-containing protein
VVGGDEEGRREGERRLWLALDNAPIGMALVSLDSRFLGVNRALCDIVGYPADELRTKTFRDITHPDDLDADLDDVRRLLAGRIRTYSTEKRFLHADGRVVWINLSVSLVREDEEVPQYFIAQIQDITERKCTEDALRASEQRFRRLIETSTEAFIAMNAEGVVTEWNRQAEATFGWSREEAIGRRLVDTIIPPSYREAHEAGLARYRATGEGSVLGRRLELEGRHRDGREFPIELTIWALGAGADLSFNALLHDISERRRTEQELWELALVDELTGLHNRRSFILLAEQAIKEAARARRPVIALFVDVDHLKEINDRLGHSEGDRALRLVAGALRAACRESDIVGRLSGDEFAVLLAEAHQQDGLEGRVRARVAEAADAFGSPLAVSIGTAVCKPGEPCKLSELFERADRAMYEEKAAKRRSSPEPDP